METPGAPLPPPPLDLTPPPLEALELTEELDALPGSASQSRSRSRDRDEYGAEPSLRTVASLADLPLRRGKWTPEEQDFSEVLIQAFLAGLVPDCADGTTLRAFLSRRLHCAPMRITKKFAGATLGKSIFSRTGVLEPGDGANLRRLESMFVRAEETNSADAVFFAMRGRAHRDGAPPAGRAARAARRGRGPESTHDSSDSDALAGVRRDAEAARSALAASESLPHAESCSSLSSLAPGASSSSQNSWAARVAECAAQTTAARRDAELSAARASFGDAGPPLLPPPSIDESPRTSLMRSLDCISAACAQPPRAPPMPMPPPRAARGMGYDKGLGAGLAARDLSSALTATRAAAGGPSNPRGDGLYGELYGWVPRDLGVNKSPATLGRMLGCPEPQRSPATLSRVVTSAQPLAAMDAAAAAAQAWGARSTLGPRPALPAAAWGPPPSLGPPGLSHKRDYSPGRLFISDDAPKQSRQAGFLSPRADDAPRVPQQRPAASPQRVDPMGASPLFGLSYRKLMVGPSVAPLSPMDEEHFSSSNTVPMRP